MARAARQECVRIARAALHSERHRRFVPARDHEAGVARIGPRRCVASPERLQKPFGPRPRRVDDNLGADLESLTAEAIARRHADDARSLDQQALRLDIIANTSAEFRRSRRESEHETRRIRLRSAVNVS